MAERKTRMNLLGHDSAVTEVPIVSTKEIAAEYELEDGSSLRVRHLATAIFRIDGVYDADGAPVYLVKSSAAPLVLTAGALVKRPTPPGP
jgi:hypothetical protein